MGLARSFRKALGREVAGWVRDGLIDRTQGEAILARYGVDTNAAERTSVGYYVLTALASLFVGVALILVISHNWDKIPRLTRMLSLFAITFVVNVHGAWLMLREREKAGVVWLFFGALCYGATIMLIAQIYHLGEHYPDGIFYWALGVFPLIFVTRSRLIALLCMVLATIWMAVETSTGFFPTSYALFALAGIWLAWVRKDTRLIFLGGVAGLVTWANLLLAWRGGGWHNFRVIADQLPGTISLGLLLTGFAWWLMRRPESGLRDYGQVLHTWLMRTGIVLLLTLSFGDVWRVLARSHYVFGILIPIFMVVCGAGGVWLARPSRRNASGPLLAHVVYFPLVFSAIYFGRVNTTWLAVSANFMLVVAGIWLIRRGIDDSIAHFFYTGVGTLLLIAVFRYFDLIGDYIGGAILFMGAAAVLFGAARYWSSRTLKGEAAHV